MATDSYMVFWDQGKKPLTAESQVIPGPCDEDLAKNIGPNKQSLSDLATAKNLFEVTDFSFNVEQTYNIGSSSQGLGAGKITFNKFSITRKIDLSSPVFYAMSCNGQAFTFVTLLLRKSVGSVGATAGSGKVYCRFDFNLVGISTLSWAHDEESPNETIEFVYGALGVRYRKQDAVTGALTTDAYESAWNAITNHDHTGNMTSCLDITGS